MGAIDVAFIADHLRALCMGLFVSNWPEFLSDEPRSRHGMPDADPSAENRGRLTVREILCPKGKSRLSTPMVVIDGVNPKCLFSGSRDC